MLKRLERFWQQPIPYWIAITILALATPRAFAPYYNFWLMPLLFGALVAITELRPHRRIVGAYWFGLIAYATQFWWIHTALHDVSGLPNLYAIPLTFLLPAFLALFPAIAFWLYEKHHLPRALALGFLLPLLWTITEFGREHVLTGFGWGALGYSQIADFSPLASLAPIGGIHLVTLATASLSCWLVLVWRNHSWIQRVIFACLIGGLLFQTKQWRGVQYTYQQPKAVSVALLQGDIPQTLKFDAKQLEPTYRTYFQQVAKTKAEIVVLPETAFPEFLQNIDARIIERFAEQAKQNGSALAIGIPAFTEDGKGYLNTMINLANFAPKQPEKIQVYAKNHLVPFGEFKPIPQLTEPLYQKMNMPLADFKRGGIGQEPFDMAGEKVAFNICYEDGFGDELIASAKKSTILANASNMAWYGKSDAMWQQLQQSQARALELGRYMIRATNNGASAIVSPQGKVLAHAPPNIPTVLEGKVHGMMGETPYMRMGTSWYVFYAMMAVAGLLMSYRPKSAHPPKPEVPTEPLQPQTTPVDTTIAPENAQEEKTEKVAEIPKEAPKPTELKVSFTPTVLTSKDIIVSPDQVQAQQARASKVNLSEQQILSEPLSNAIKSAVRQTQETLSSTQEADSDEHETAETSGLVRLSTGKRQNHKPKRKKNKKRK